MRPEAGLCDEFRPVASDWTAGASLGSPDVDFARVHAFLADPYPFVFVLLSAPPVAMNFADVVQHRYELPLPVDLGSTSKRKPFESDRRCDVAEDRFDHAESEAVYMPAPRAVDLSLHSLERALGLLFRSVVLDVHQARRLLMFRAQTLASKRAALAVRLVRLKLHEQVAFDLCSGAAHPHGVARWTSARSFLQVVVELINREALLRGSLRAVSRSRYKSWVATSVTNVGDVAVDRLLLEVLHIAPAVLAAISDYLRPPQTSLLF